MGPYQRTPKEVTRAIRYSGLGVRSVGPVGDFLEWFICDSYSDASLFTVDFFIVSDHRIIEIINTMIW